LSVVEGGTLWKQLKDWGQFHDDGAREVDEKEERRWERRGGEPKSRRLPHSGVLVDGAVESIEH
jgi:hypothetical protein